MTASSYDLLTAGTRFKVFDVETCVDADGFRRIVALSIVDIVDGEIHYPPTGWLINPETPIDSASNAIHSISDHDVADQPPFRDLLPEILTALTTHPSQPATVIWVAHNAPFDLSALHWAFNQADTPFPKVLVLDTLTLPAFVGDPKARGWNLPAMADRYGIDGLNHHAATSDATTCARILQHLLRLATRQQVADLDTLLHDADAKLSDEYAVNNSGAAPAPDVHPPQPAGHLAGHPDPLPDNPTKRERKVWALAFLACADVGCEHARTLSRELENHPGLFDEVGTQAKRTLTPGSVGVATYLGAIASPELLAITNNGHRLVSWWTPLRRQLTPQRCPTVDAASRCPDCREGLPCPSDVFYQTVANVACGVQVHGFVGVAVVAKYAKSSSQLRAWTSQGSGDVAAFTAWLCMERATALGDINAVGRIRAHVESLHLDVLEPRLAFLSAIRLLSTDQKGTARDIVDAALAVPSTDPFLPELREFHNAHLLPVPPIPPREVKTKPRFGVNARRPEHRRPDLRFKVG